MDKEKGAALTQHHLLSLALPGNDVKALEEFRPRFKYIWEALEVAERPTEASIRSLLFEQLKATLTCNFTLIVSAMHPRSPAKEHGSGCIPICVT